MFVTLRNKKIRKFCFYLKMKNLPRLPLEIWLMILKIRRWTDRKNFLIAFHNSPKNIDYHTAEQLEFWDEDPKQAKTEGWFEYYTMFNKTYIYCPLKYPKIRNTRYLQDLIIRQMIEYYFATADNETFWYGATPVGWGDKCWIPTYTNKIYAAQEKLSYTNRDYKKVKIKPNTVYYFGWTLKDSKAFIYFNKI